MVKYDVTVFGATGFTGMLVAEHLLSKYGAQPKTFKWALAGRSAAKLEASKQKLVELGFADAASLPTLVGDVNDPASMDGIASQSKVVVTTVGPYTLYGENLVAACARSGSHCLDLTGESSYVKRVMMEKYGATAKQTGAKLVPSVGFDSLPADLGCLFMAEELRKHSTTMKDFDYRLNSSKMSGGGVSGGTIASVDIITEQMWNGEVSMKEVMSPQYLLDSGNEMPEASYAGGFGLLTDADGSRGWTAPCIFGAHDSKLVFRSNSVLQYDGTGRGITYRATTYFPGVVAGLIPALFATLAITTFSGLLFFPPTKRLVLKFLPKPSEGPSRETRESAKFCVDLKGVGASGVEVKGEFGSDVGDPGYKETAKMMAESGLCLALDEDKITRKEGGVVSPAVGMGMALVERLRNADMYIRVTGVTGGKNKEA